MTNDAQPKQTKTVVVYVTESVHAERLRPALEQLGGICLMTRDDPEINEQLRAGEIGLWILVTNDAMTASKQIERLVGKLRDDKRPLDLDYAANVKPEDLLEEIRSFRGEPASAA